MITSDDFSNDWYGWLTNQCGHIVLGLGVSVAMLWAVWWIGKVNLMQAR